MSIGLNFSLEKQVFYICYSHKKDTTAVRTLIETKESTLLLLKSVYDLKKINILYSVRFSLERY